jgi:hypothetical protein
MNKKFQQLAVFQRQLLLEIVERQRKLINNKAYKLVIKLDTIIKTFVSNSDQLVQPLNALKAELVATTGSMVTERIEQHYREREKQAREADPLRLQQKAYHQVVANHVVDK